MSIELSESIAKHIIKPPTIKPSKDNNAALIDLINSFNKIQQSWMERQEALEGRVAELEEVTRVCG